MALVIECPCGHTLRGGDRDELIQRCREHLEQHHPDMSRTDEQLRARVDADAREE
jgi:hypothetical protein